MAKNLPVNVSEQDYRTYLRVKRALTKANQRKKIQAQQERIQIQCLEEQLEKLRRMTKIEVSIKYSVMCCVIPRYCN